MRVRCLGSRFPRVCVYCNQAPALVKSQSKARCHQQALAHAMIAFLTRQGPLERAGRLWPAHCFDGAGWRVAPKQLPFIYGLRRPGVSDVGSVGLRNTVVMEIYGWNTKRALEDGSSWAPARQELRR
jgi:hypothetical protein